MGANMRTPDEEVAGRIIEVLRKKNLLSEVGIKKIERGLSSGKLTQEDWRLVFETDRGSKEDADASKS
jgi:hypothetical protein